MMTTVAEFKIRTNPKLESDLRMLQREFGTHTLAETIRRAIAREVVLQRAISTHREVTIEGKNKKTGKTVTFLP